LHDVIPAKLKCDARGRAADRRAFVLAILGAGVAMAVPPVRGQTTATSADGLVAGDVKVPTKDGTIPAYRAMPGAGGSYPVILVIHDVSGLDRLTQDICRRIAGSGYFAIAPELYVRQGAPSKSGNPATLAGEIVAKIPDSQVDADLDACVAYAKSTGKAETARLGITGFGWGGRTALMYAAHNADVKAAVPWYGPAAQSYFAGDRTPLDLTPQIRAAVLGLYAGADAGIPNATVEKLFANLKAAGNVRSHFIVYPDTPGAFNAVDRPGYRKQQAEDAWNRMIAWFKLNL